MFIDKQVVMYVHPVRNIRGIVGRRVQLIWQKYFRLSESESQSYFDKKNKKLNDDLF